MSQLITHTTYRVQAGLNERGGWISLGRGCPPPKEFFLIFKCRVLCIFIVNKIFVARNQDQGVAQKRGFNPSPHQTLSVGTSLSSGQGQDWQTVHSL